MIDKKFEKFLPNSILIYSFLFLQMLIALGFSIFQDILLLALYEPRGYSLFEENGEPNN